MSRLPLSVFTGLVAFVPSLHGAPASLGPATNLLPPPPPMGPGTYGGNPDVLDGTFVNPDPDQFSAIPPLPLRPGDLVVTLFPDLVAGIPPLSDPSGYCVKVVRGAADGPLGENHEAPFFSNEDALPNHVWNLENLGPVFGCCLDEAIPPNIYVTASTVYGNWGWGIGGSGAVYKLNGVTGDISVFATLPNPSGAGLGDICYDRFNRQFFVSNFEDGKIYRIRLVTGSWQIVQAFDPWAQDDAAPDPDAPAILGERIWAVHMPDNDSWGGRALFFSAWLRDEGRPTTPWPVAWPPLLPGETPNNAIFRVAVNANGSIDTVGAPEISVIMPVLPPLSSTHSNPVSDIVSLGRRLIVAEHRMDGDVGRLGFAHWARVMRFGIGVRTSTPILPPLFVGDTPVATLYGMNSAGGVAIDIDNRLESDPTEANIWATGDALHYPTFPPGSVEYLYGVQSLPWGGNGGYAPNYSAITHLVDMDHDTTAHDKEQIGDVEHFAGSIPDFDFAWSQRFCSGDTYVLCPCGNFGDPGNGCANSVNPGGAALDLAGAAATDDVVLLGSGMPSFSACVYLQGSQSTQAPFGDGVICLSGAIVRLRVKLNAMGASSFPDGGDSITLSQRGGVTPGSGAVRYYQVYYRNTASSFCQPETFNISNGWEVTW